MITIFLLNLNLKNMTEIQNEQNIQTKNLDQSSDLVQIDGNKIKDEKKNKISKF